MERQASIVEGPSSRPHSRAGTSGAFSAREACSPIPRPSSRGTTGRRHWPRRVSQSPSPTVPIHIPTPGNFSMRGVLGLPHCPGAAPNCDETVPTPTPRPESVALLARVREAGEAQLDERYVFGDKDRVREQRRDTIKELLGWMQPRKRDGGFLSGLTRLALEIDMASQEWNAYLGGHCSRLASLEAVAAEESLPKVPLHTAQAASLLLQLVRALPQGLPLQLMLEPLTHELLKGIYRDWLENVASLHQLSEFDVSVAGILQHVPFYTLVSGHKAVAEAMRAKTEVAIAAQIAAETRMAPWEEEINALKTKLAELEAELRSEKQARVDAEQRAMESDESFEHFKAQARTALSSHSDLVYREETQLADIRALKKENAAKEEVVVELRMQVSMLSRGKLEVETKLMELQRKLEMFEKEMLELPELRDRLARFDREEAMYGIAYARRIALEVFGSSVEVLCSTGRKVFMPKGKQQAVLDKVLVKLKGTALEAKSLKQHVNHLEQQLRDVRQLVPSWDEDFLHDIEQAYTFKPVHRQIFEMKDKRCFAGLGLSADVPIYLRAEGFIRHVYISKGEIETFIQHFLQHLMDLLKAGSVEFSDEFLHSELHKQMQLEQGDGEPVTEFAYAFICALDVYRDDPDFELFDWLLSGVIHPSVMQDQAEMLKEMSSLMQKCQEHQAADAHKKNSRRVASTSLQHREMVDRRLVRAVLSGLFPDKTPARQSALRRATANTFKMLRDAGRASTKEMAYITDLFANTADGSQSPLIEETRRQHLHEIIEFAGAVGRRIQQYCIESSGGHKISTHDSTIDAKALKTIMEAVDPHIPADRLDALVSTAFGNDTQQPALVQDVFQKLRRGGLLRPQQLWVHADATEVVRMLITMGFKREEGKSIRTAGPGVRIIDNHLEKAVLYSTPESLADRVDIQMVAIDDQEAKREAEESDLEEDHQL